MSPVLAFMPFGLALVALLVCITGLLLYGVVFLFWLRTGERWAATLLVSIGGVMAAWILIDVLRTRRRRKESGEPWKIQGEPSPSGRGPHGCSTRMKSDFRIGASAPYPLTRYAADRRFPLRSTIPRCVGGIPLRTSLPTCCAG
jgi:hypothetical protein